MLASGATGARRSRDRVSLDPKNLFWLAAESGDDTRKGVELPADLDLYTKIAFSLRNQA